MTHLGTLFVIVLALAPSARAHGGAYRGPGTGAGDTVPGASSSTSSSSGTSSGSTAAGGVTTPAGPGTAAPTSSNPQPTPSTGAAAAGPGADLTRWQSWWGFNKDAYLGLRERVGAGGVVSGSDEAFLARREPTRDELLPTAEDLHKRVKPALRALLQSETNNDVLSGAIVALAKIGEEPGERAVAGWIAPFLAHPNQELAETAAVALGILGDARDVELLRAMLSGDLEAIRSRGAPLVSAPSERTRAFAAYGLGLVAHRCEGAARELAVESLVTWMSRSAASSSQSEVPVACVTALGLAPLPSDPLVPILSSSSAPERVASLEEQLQWLAFTLERRDLSPRVRAHVPIAMARLLKTQAGQASRSREVAVDRIVARLARDFDEVSEVRAGCVIALGRIGTASSDALDQRIRRSLCETYKSSRDAQFGYFALIALAQASSRPGPGSAPLSALDSGKEETRAWILAQLSDGASATRCYAALALGVLERGAADARAPQSAEVLAALRRALDAARSPDELGALALALGVARDGASVPILRRQLEEASDREARGHIAIALGLVGDRTSIARIQELVAKSKYHPELLRNAAIALGLLGDKEIVPQLVDMLRNSTSLAARAAVASALGLIGDRRSLEPLMAMAANREECTDLARAFAAVALGMCGDKELLPWNAKLAADANYRANTSTLYSPDTGTGILDIL